MQAHFAHFTPFAFHSAAATAVTATMLVTALPAMVQPVPAPQVTTHSWILTDVTSGQVFGGTSMDERIEPALLTKLMAAYLVFEVVRDGKLKYDQMIMPTKTIRIVKTDGSHMFLETGRPASVRKMTQGLIAQSGNDAALVLAEAVGGTETSFVVPMNREAKRLDMKNTHFANTAGLSDPSHYSTTRNLSILTAALIKDFPQDYRLYSWKEFAYSNIKQPDRSRLLWLDPAVDGGKANHTKSAGYYLVAFTNRPLPDMSDANCRLLSVIIGIRNDTIRTQESLKVLSYGYQFFDTVRLYEAKEALQAPDVHEGQTKSMKLGVVEGKWVTVPKDADARLKPVLERKDPLIAPITQGRQLDTVRVMDGSTAVSEFPMVALRAMSEVGFVGRTINAVKLWFRKEQLFPLAST